MHCSSKPVFIRVCVCVCPGGGAGRWRSGGRSGLRDHQCVGHQQQGSDLPPEWLHGCGYWTQCSRWEKKKHLKLSHVLDGDVFLYFPSIRIQSWSICTSLFDPLQNYIKALVCSDPGSVPGVAFTRVSASDEDDPETPNAHLHYSLVSQMPNKNQILLFQIDPNTGEISTTEEGAAHKLRPNTHRVSLGKSIICPPLPVIWQYSDTLNPDYTAHLVCSRLNLIGGRLPRCVAWCWSLIALSVWVCEDARTHLCTVRGV